jgi:hypothetical protein
VDVRQEPCHLAQIRAAGPAHVAAACVSDDGAHLAFCQDAPGSVRLFRLDGAAEVRPCNGWRQRAAPEIWGVGVGSHMCVSLLTEQQLGAGAALWWKHALARDVHVLFF